MTIVNLEHRLRKIEAARFKSDPALKALSDAELVAEMRKSDNPLDHQLADWFLDGAESDLSPGAFEILMRGIR